MMPAMFLPDPQVLQFEALTREDDAITTVAYSTPSEAQCPRCGSTSHRIHSRYVRSILDLSWQGFAGRLQLHVRRFFCVNEQCSQRVFCERLPSVVAAYGRRTLRLWVALRSIAMTAGAEAGAWITEVLAIGASADTLLRGLRRAALPDSTAPRVLGVDDFAFRRGQNYGTILVDLEAHRVIDLLPDRKADTLAEWLKAHPGVEIISRDRAGAYAEGATRGAPAAQQVADRWHLLKNLGDVVDLVLVRNNVVLKQAAERLEAESKNKRSDETFEVIKVAGAEITTANIHAVESAIMPQETAETRKGKSEIPEESVPAEPMVRTCHDEAGADSAPAPQQSWGTREEREHAWHREARLLRYEEVMARHHQGLGIRAIAGELGLDRKTVRRYIRASSFQERSPRASIVDPWADYVSERVVVGATNVRSLLDEMRARGYRGSYNSLIRFIRQKLGRNGTTPSGNKRQETKCRPISRRRAARLLSLEHDELETKDQTFVDKLCEISPELAKVRSLARRFIDMIKGRRTDRLKSWLEEAQDSNVPEIESYASGLKRDRAAVEAALRLDWSNGQVEGQVNRLKTVKRQMFGRANFDLLRLRVLGRRPKQSRPSPKRAPPG